jgi:uncharacterized protein YciI
VCIQVINNEAMMFVIKIRFTAPLETVNNHVVAHRFFEDHFYSTGHFICSGAILGRTGNVIICVANSTEEVEQIITQDPYQTHNVAKYEVVPFIPTKYISSLVTIIKQ